MPDSNAVGGLKWVKDEIVASIQRVRARLEDFDESGNDPEQSRLEETVGALSEVRGVLSALELTGPARLTEEMGQLCKELVAESVPNSQQASEALMLALIRLSDFLDRVDAGQAEDPRGLLPSINELRALHAVAPLSEGELLAPVSSVAEPQTPPPEVIASMRQIGRELRPYFHLHLLQWLRGESPRQGLVELGRLCLQFHEVSAEGNFHDLFLVAAAVVEAVLDGSIAEDAKTKTLISRLDRVIKPLATEQEAWPEAEVRGQLVDLLSAIAHCEPASDRIIELLSSYGLAPEGESKGEDSTTPMAGPGPEAFSMLVAAARKELAPIKDALDLFSRGDRGDPEQLLELGPQLRKLANSLAVAGADELADRLRQCGDDLEAVGQGRSPADDPHLAEVAEELLAIEMALGDLGLGESPEAGGEAIRALVVSTLKEMQLDVAKAEGGINEIVTAPADERASKAKDISELFRRVAGALRVLSENEAAEVLDIVSEHVQRRFQQPLGIMNEGELDLLAQAVSGIDLYLVGLSEGEHYSSNLVAEARRAVDELKSAAIPSLVLDEEEPLPGISELGTDTAEPEEAGLPTTGIDPDFLDIFLEEVNDEEERIREHFGRWRDEVGDQDALVILQRSFHTLKGSGRLVGAMRIGELAQAIEMLFNNVFDRTLTATPEVVRVVGDAIGVLPDLITAEVQQQPLDIGDIVSRAESLALSATGKAVVSSVPVEKPGAGEAAPRARILTPVSEQAQAEPIEPRAPDTESPAGASEGAEELAPSDQEEADELATLATADDELLDIFRSEAREHVGTLRSFLAGIEDRTASAIPDESVVRALHTLTGSARVTGVQSTAKVTAPLERLFLGHQSQGTEPDPSLLQLVSGMLDALEERLEHLPGYGREMATLRAIAGEIQPHLARIESVPAEAGKEPPAEPVLETEAEAKEQELAQESEEEALAAQDVLVPEIAQEALVEESLSATQVSEEPIPSDTPSEVEAPKPKPKPKPPEPMAPEAEPGVPPRDVVPLTQDPELINLFLEDARDMVDRLDQSLRDLQRAPVESAPLEAMQRSLHTLKGSARLAGLTPIGDLSHAFESLLTAVAHGEARMVDDTLELAQQALDTLSDQIDAVERRADLRRADELVQAMAMALEEGLASSAGAAPDVAVMAPSPEIAARPAAEAVPSAPAPAKAAPSAASEAPAPQIRVRAHLIDRLVNNAGEISIYGSRLAQQGGLMAFRLGDLERTVDRLRGQLRHLEMETEAQILHRYERDGESLTAGQVGFDPLELDRFSTLQQLSRSLAETVNDLVSIRVLLRDLQSESDTLLQQQGRIANDLQDGLLRTRMVPFAQAVPRLHRVVRQTAQQMGKEARLEVFGPEVEVDRGIQERILAPLEHLLRNAVAHGIELPEQREQVGKPATGVVSLVLNREGNDVVITVADDGAGLDLEAIRRKALAKGLITESSQPTEEELTGLILETGFSTAEEVSQIAGRGVGLDVVNTEIKQLSGSFGLESQSGRGTLFTIRLPLTLAIIDALLVQLGDQFFAIPHATIEGVSRISRADLEACYRGSGSDFSYGGRDYRVMYLGSILQLSGAPDLGERRWLPVLLARSGEQRFAVHVEQLLGNQRTVVKPLGPELSNIRWLSGGTILPDGRVAMILDLLALIRSAAMQEIYTSIQPQLQERATRPCVMVVDDSLTVRRVTSRMLQRQNMEVITARDGVDALTRLEERVPDVILLDIEMPRMDGYELTRHIRRSERLKAIPLIMITSRTGEKHRHHAMELGVDRYLGKPYQETDLLDEISSVLVEASL